MTNLDLCRAMQIMAEIDGHEGDPFFWEGVYKEYLRMFNSESAAIKKTMIDFVEYMRD